MLSDVSRTDLVVRKAFTAFEGMAQKAVLADIIRLRRRIICPYHNLRAQSRRRISGIPSLYPIDGLWTGIITMHSPDARRIVAPIWQTPLLVRIQTWMKKYKMSICEWNRNDLGTHSPTANTFCFRFGFSSSFSILQRLYCDSGTVAWCFGTLFGGIINTFSVTSYGPPSRLWFGDGARR